jgi:hypothetical protein
MEKQLGSGREASTQPSGTIDLQHSYDGTRNKNMVKLLSE